MRTLPIFRNLFIAFFAWLFTLVYWGIVSGVCVLSARTLSDRLMVPAARRWGRMMLWLSGVTMEVEGEEFLKDRCPRVFIFNHQSVLDMFWVGCIAPPGSFVVAKRELQYVPGVNFAVWGSRSIFIDRGDREKALASLQHVAARLRDENATIIMAPEGTRTRDGSMRPFKKGPFQISRQSGAPLYPVVVSNAYALQPPGAILASGGRLRVRCLEPIDTSAWKDDELEERIQAVWQQMHDACDDYSSESGDG